MNSYYEEFKDETLESLIFQFGKTRALAIYAVITVIKSDTYPEAEEEIWKALTEYIDE